LFHDFCFANRDSATVAIARLITPMCRGLMGWTARPPVFIFEGNRPRAGKDYLAGCTSVLYEGHANEDAPLDSEREETIKRIGAALSSGRRFMHFANCKGRIDNAGFEQASTAKVFNCRKPGETVFTSFPEWARVVGGILTSCGLGDPCVTQLDGCTAAS
jgi:hypothetical protein